MPMLADLADALIGVDTHTGTHTAAIVNRLGAHLATAEVTADAAGYAQLTSWASKHAPGPRIAWAAGGCGSHGAGLAHALAAAGHLVIEADRPKKARRRGGKSDELDAIRAARQALAIPDPAQPRTGDTREALRILLATREHATKTRTATVNTLKALILTAPEDLRAQFRGRRTAAQVRAAWPCGPAPASPSANSTCARRPAPARPPDHRPRRCLENQPQKPPKPGPHLDARPAHRARHRPRQRRPAAGHLVSPRPVPHRSRLRSPHRHRTDPRILRPHRPPPHHPYGDRNANRALHTIAISRLRYHQPTIAYATRRTAEGKTTREIRRCIKRYLARNLYRLMEHH